MAESMREVYWNRGAYHVETDSDASTVWEGGDALFSVPGTDWTDDQIRALLTVYFTGRNVGESSGRITLQSELRRLIGAAAIGDV